jgi:hypothetical protein
VKPSVRSATWSPFSLRRRFIRGDSIWTPPLCTRRQRLVTDGPFAETREQLGGYYLINAKNLDEALDIAARIPMAREGTVEIRPVIEIAGLPTG